jgi:hypothetical protein
LTIRWWRGVTGLVTGLGQQLTGAVLAFGSYWCIGLPLAAILGFMFTWGCLGMWVGLLVATLLQCGAMAFMALRLDWKTRAEWAVANVLRDAAAAALMPTSSAASSAATPLHSVMEKEILRRDIADASCPGTIV